jgi:hypothetical protein
MHFAWEVIYMMMMIMIMMMMYIIMIKMMIIHSFIHSFIHTFIHSFVFYVQCEGCQREHRVLEGPAASHHGVAEG